MIKCTSSTPDKHLKEIKKYMVENKFDPKVNFQMQISPNIEVVQGRILNAPELAFRDANGKPILERPALGAWNMVGKQAYQGSVLETWSILCLADAYLYKPDALAYFCDELIKALVALGVVVKAKPVLYHWDPETTTVGDAIQASMDASFKKTGKKPQIIVCIKETSDKVLLLYFFFLFFFLFFSLSLMKESITCHVSTQGRIRRHQASLRLQLGGAVSVCPAQACL